MYKHVNHNRQSTPASFISKVVQIGNIFLMQK